MVSLADLLLAYIPYRLPTHLYSYVSEVTPLSTDKAVLSALATYLVTIFSIQAFMKSRQPLKLTTLFQIHNVILSSGSALLLALMLEEILPVVWNRGLYHAICAAEAWSPVSVLACYDASSIS
jgi:fatty acid elongase 3